MLAGTLTAPLRKLRQLGGRAQEKERFWALRDVNFDIAPGEVVGIIGRNGAGKSTLLKILSRITAPSRGKVEIRGRVASLLEVGTGFHPELTGRENIFLNGAILGMTRREIDRKLDAIVEFSEINRFVDTPVKHYSSGMYVRLAFAVAAHLEPDILLVDEVLAVGDIGFQKKCLGKMDAVAKDGRTVFFVSHNMDAISRLCSRCLWLEEGRNIEDGSANATIARYQQRYIVATTKWTRTEETDENNVFAFYEVTVSGKDGRKRVPFDGDEAVQFDLRYKIHRAIPGCQIAARIARTDGLVVLTTTDVDAQRIPAKERERGSYRARFTIKGGLLAPGTYTLLIAAQFPRQKIFEAIDNVAVFEISTVRSLSAIDDRKGVVCPPIYWQTELEN
jgi:lipopolysaccharide transport system ATP-binding protein